MKRKYNIIVLCGSSRFEEEFSRVERELTLAGNVVLSDNILYSSERDFLTSEQIEMLYKIHLQKIDIAKELYVVDKDGYIEEDTEREIEYAKSKGKKVVYMVDMNEILTIDRAFAENIKLYAMFSAEWVKEELNFRESHNNEKKFNIFDVYTLADLRLLYEVLSR